MIASLRDKLERRQVLAQAFADLALTSAACASRLSSVPNSLSHLAAVFGPTFGTPGILSELSPTSREVVDDLFREYLELAFTPARSSVVSVIVLTSFRRPSTSCAISLSPVETTTSRPASSPRFASVPIPPRRPLQLPGYAEVAGPWCGDRFPGAVAICDRKFVGHRRNGSALYRRTSSVAECPGRARRTRRRFARERSP